MTDNEIIKALNEADGLDEVSVYCADSKGENPSTIKMTDVVDLINSQKAEIERLKKDLDIINAANAELYGAFEENERLKSEIERLEKHTELYHELKSENRKEFAERLKNTDLYEFIEEYYENAELCYEVRQDQFEEYIDNLVKEMEQGNER